MTNNQGGRQEGPAQSDKDKGSAQPGMPKDADKFGKKGQHPGEKSGENTDDDSNPNQAKKGGQQGGKTRQ